MKLFLGILCSAVAVGALGTVVTAQSMSGGAASPRWVCRQAGSGDTANASLKDGSAQMVCKEVFVTVKTVSGRTLVIGRPTSMTGSPNKATTIDMTRAADAKAAQDAEDIFTSELLAGGGG